MSKRTLDAFLVTPAAATVKRTKKLSNAESSTPSRATAKKQPDGLKPGQVIDLDEVIDLSSPPPENHRLLLSSSTGKKSDVEVLSIAAFGRDGNSDAEVVSIPVTDPSNATASCSKDRHTNYPFPIPRLSSTIHRAISDSPIKEPKILNHLPHLDLLSFEPYIGIKDAREYGEFLRRELPFYRVEYKLTRFGKETDIKTPRFTVR